MRSGLSPIVTSSVEATSCPMPLIFSSCGADARVRRAIRSVVRSSWSSRWATRWATSRRLKRVMASRVSSSGRIRKAMQVASDCLRSDHAAGHVSVAQLAVVDLALWTSVPRRVAVEYVAGSQARDCSPRDPRSSTHLALFRVQSGLTRASGISHARPPGSLLRRAATTTRQR